MNKLEIRKTKQSPTPEINRSCNSIASDVSNAWCNLNCNHNPPYCPSTKCKCDSTPAPTPGPAPTPVPTPNLNSEYRIRTNVCQQQNSGFKYIRAVNTPCRKYGCNAAINDSREWIDQCNSGVDGNSCCTTDEEMPPPCVQGPCPNLNRLTPYPASLQLEEGLDSPQTLWQNVTYADICNSGDVLCPGGISPGDPGYGSTTYWSIGGEGFSSQWCWDFEGIGVPNRLASCIKSDFAICSTGWVPNMDDISTQLCVKSCGNTGRTLSTLFPTNGGTQQCICFSDKILQSEHLSITALERGMVDTGLGGFTNTCSKLMCSSTDTNGAQCAIDMGLDSYVNVMGDFTYNNTNRALLGNFISPDNPIINACGTGTGSCDFSKTFGGYMTGVIG